MTGLLLIFFYLKFPFFFFLGFKELPSNGALLLYISADGYFTQSKHHEDGKYKFSKSALYYYFVG